MSSVILPTTHIMSSAENKVENGSTEEEQRGKKRKMSLSSCGVCGSEEAKYRCPACLTHSCSLPCVKKHKEASGCSGVRNKTAFVTLSQFDEMTLLSDYRFLEDTGRFANGATRDNLVQAPRVTVKSKKLASNARKMNITLRFLPITFTKSRENSTFFLTKLKMYVQARFDHVKVFMKVEGRKANAVRYHELDIEKSLRDNLSYKTLIEYPVLHVVLKDHWKDYPLKGPAEPASACAPSAEENDKVGQEKETTQFSPSPQRSPTTGETNISRTAQEIEPPPQKKAKRGYEDEEQEEGEITDSSDEDDKNIPCDKSCDDAKDPANDTKDEVQ
uniref:Box C/D snoRNA protein 1 n=1 Tax=Oreochromis aureus TaxID=47969 RepID=A0A668V7B8_OREAU